MSDYSIVRNQYDRMAEMEEQRLKDHPMERLVTLDTISLHLGPHLDVPLKIADIGGGTGVYAFILAKQGHSVHLRDLSPGLLVIASEEQAGNAVYMDSMFRPSDEGTFDAVLLLGPLYHIVDEADRLAAISNALKLLKDSGTLFASFVSINAHIRGIAIRDPGRLLREPEFYDEYLRSGHYVRRGERNAESFHASLSEIQPLIERAGGTVLEIVGVEGILGGGLDKFMAEAGDHVIQAWLHLMKDLGRRPENLGNADHWLAVIRKPVN
ncbi:S-adenosyl-L-methionine-dependent methyltransferase [Rickenella mellea]|uniref:S-adenosyl-L-methionine-dependent methyltransferase n=1 Tax=Rickenella mellea TaxID=50990 RepID=A0A4Y7QJ55_9AGAM|nr:S-adenosyl-L-methionine-dependent methyltransferase [Rickenella mellea]